ncbi:MAG TPA: hypothetical protein VFR52_07890 [Sphingomicrobium sp.]|nr:hypothetical protein [Sphingomicrobium sp.]
MRKLILAAGVAALAVTAPVSAKPDKGGGKGGEAQAQRGGGGGGQKAQRRGGGGDRQAQRAERRGGAGERQMQRMERRGGERQAQRMERRGGERQAQRMERRGNERRFANFQRDRDERRAQRVERRGGDERRAQRIERRGDDRRIANFQRDRNERRAQTIENRRELRNRDRDDGRFAFVNQRDDRIFEARRRNAAERNVWRNRDEGPRISWRERNDDFRRVDRWRDWNDRDWDRAYAFRGIPAAYVGCPPGLAKKSWSCVPPGLARNMFIGTALPTHYASNQFPVGLRDLYYDTDDYYYRWGDGYAYRVDRDDQLISALLPLIGAGLGVGMPFPYQGPSYYVPSNYQSFYPDYGYDDDYYRYANGYVYEIDGSSGYIEDVIPLLDRGYGVGQMLPAGYSYYNVPYQYREAYYDTDDYYYRYAPGAIYQVDRDTQLITAIASLLTGGLSVGQPLPAAYGVYNVPMSYRDMYYDTPDHWYRYSNGYIYQVDPTTQLITAIVRSIV